MSSIRSSTSALARFSLHPFDPARRAGAACDAILERCGLLGALLQHCYNEFTFLSRFLPSLFIAENRRTHEVALPW